MFDPKNFTPEEAARLERLLKLNKATIDRLERVASQDEKMEWLWGSIRRVASTVAIVVGAIVIFWDQLKSVVRAMAGQ